MAAPQGGTNVLLRSFPAIPSRLAMKGDSGVVSSLSILVMLNLFQHPWADLSSAAAVKEATDHGS
jgi:hypothetical protein